MSLNEIVTTASPEQTFALLLDPYVYPDWVVGTKRIRAVDEGWPTPGSRFHHSVGIGPLATRDFTSMVSWSRPTRIDLDVRFRPLGTARVSIRISEGVGGGSRVLLREEPATGPVTGFHGRVFNAVAHIRNALSLRRFRRLTDSSGTPTGVTPTA